MELEVLVLIQNYEFPFYSPVERAGRCHVVPVPSAGSESGTNAGMLSQSRRECGTCQLGFRVTGDACVKPSSSKLLIKDYNFSSIQNQQFHSGKNF